MHFDQYMNTTTAEIRLPRINISSFDGNYHEWPSFCDIFTTAIHNNNGLTDSHKFQYHVTSENYQTAWNKLKERYDNKKHIITSFIKTFMEQSSSVSSTTTVYSHLRKICDTTYEIIRGLQQLGTHATSRDPWMIHILLGKLDAETRLYWAQKSETNDSPTIEEFVQFLNSRCNILEVCNASVKRSTFTKPQPSIKMYHTSVESSSCSHCSATDHTINRCQHFLQLPIPERRSSTQANNLCFNYLRIGHFATTCSSKNTCKVCKGLHHTLLHLQSFTNTSSCKSMTLLATALVNVRDNNGHLHQCRALLDSAAQSSLITEACVQRLGLRRQHTRVAVNGVGSILSGISRGLVTIQASSIHNQQHSIELDPLILGKITNPLPSTLIDVSAWQHIEHLPLADPTFNQPGKIDILIGADKFLHLLWSGKKYNSETATAPIAHNSMFGWIVSGEIDKQQIGTSITCSVTTTNNDLDYSLRRFWEVEEIHACTNQDQYTEEEQACETSFVQTHTRDDTGRFIVKLPFKGSTQQLGDSFNIALKRFELLERKLNKNKSLHQEYTKFINEYLNLGHMQLMSNDELQAATDHQYYLPHHAVIKNSSSTTKLRVVFDGSAKTTSGISLNDQLMVGPTIQQTLTSILSRFRTHRVVFTADIAKMYRQVLVDINDTRYQRILWRNPDNNQLQHYKLLTVTYGTSSAPFLATRSLHQLALLNEEKYPIASKVTQRDFYVDDLMSGADSASQATTIQAELIHLLEDGGFQLRKWASNHPEVLKAIPVEFCEMNPIFLDNDPKSIKIFGVQWDPYRDCFSYKVSMEQNNMATKRIILSEASRIFDPIGWLAPATVKIKILFQDLWLSELAWDDPLSEIESTTWKTIRNEFHYFERITIPRWISSTGQQIQLHGFADASEKAYAAVIYSRCLNDNGELSIHLITAKTKVCPIKQISIARLELCAALLLTRLMKTTIKSLALPDVQCFGWADSTITLAWLSDHPRRWKTFIANRASEILSFWPRNQWRHVTTSKNPADYASRGILPSELASHQMWWSGPDWLATKEDYWPRQPELLNRNKD